MKNFFAISILILPILALLIVFFGWNYLRNSQIIYITTGSIISSFLLSCVTFFYVISTQMPITVIADSEWFTSGLLQISWGCNFDSITIVMLITITFVSSLVHIYSIEYMAKDESLARFMSYLTLFTLFMLILVTSNNLVGMFLGWEGVGLASYLLINFWNTRVQANKSAIKAIVINRIGDFGLIVAMMAIFHFYHTMDFFTIFALTPSVSESVINFFFFKVRVMDFIAFFLFVGAVGKSAQLGLHTWLPDAMEGPTPVSALIHAATMVTAGVFVLVRCSPILEFAPNILTFITITGGLTALFAATTGMLQNDMKRVIAYSTCSQLGYMVFACGMSAYSVSMFHLMNHATFKALLFLGAGSVIHAMNDEQDMRKMGGLVNILPFTYSIFVIGSLSLMGFPFLTGFYSKDLILEVACSFYSFEGFFVYWFGAIAAFFTAFYSIRLIYLTFIARSNALKVSVEGVHEAPTLMFIPLVLLSVASVFVGYVMKDAFVGLGTNFWGASIFIFPDNARIFGSEFLPAYVKMIPVIFSIIGATISYIVYDRFFNFAINLNLSKEGLFFYRFFNKKWYFDVIYNYFILKKVMNFSYYTSFKLLDRGFVEYIGPFGIVYIIKKISLRISALQTGFVYHYAFLLMLGVAVCFTIVVFSFTNIMQFDSSTCINFLMLLIVSNYVYSWIFSSQDNLILLIFS